MIRQSVIDKIEQGSVSRLTLGESDPIEELTAGLHTAISLTLMNDKRRVQKVKAAFLAHAALMFDGLAKQHQGSRAPDLVIVPRREEQQ